MKSDVLARTSPKMDLPAWASRQVVFVVALRACLCLVESSALNACLGYREAQARVLTQGVEIDGCTAGCLFMRCREGYWRRGEGQRLSTSSRTAPVEV